MTAMLIYIVINRDTIHKPSVFVLFGIYAVYTAIETVILSKTAKKK
jgi:Ca2+/Na+ antiporter